MRNAIVDQILMERMNRRGGYDGRDYARGDYGRGGYDGRRGRDYDEERFEDEDEKYLMEMQDGRRGVKGTGRGRRRGRRRDYGETLSLTKSDIMNWKHNLENADGTRGPHFNMEQVMEAAKAVGDGKGLSVVMSKDTVLYGGVDITDQVLKKLASDAKK